MRQLRQDNFKIQFLDFEQMSEGNPGLNYIYNLFEDKAILTKKDELHINNTAEVEIKEPSKIDELVYNIIKNWKRNYKPDFMIFDSLYWKLNIELQDGKKYRFKGYHETPDNFENLETLFETVIKIKKAE